MNALLLLCLLFLWRESFGYANTPTPVSIICMKERFSCLITSTPVSNILVEGEVWLRGQS